MNGSSEKLDDTRPRIAFVLPSFSGGGAEHVALTMVSAMDRAHFEPVLVVLDAKGPLRGRVPPEVSVEGLGQPRLSAALPALITTLRRLKPAVLFSTFTHINAPLLALRFLFPGTRFLLREASLPSANLGRMPWPGAFRAAYRLLYPSARAIIATSRRMRDELTVLGVPAGVIHLLHNPVDETSLRDAAIPETRQPGDGIRYVAAGRLSREKGFDRLLDIMAMLPANAHCTILGEGPERAALEEQVARLGLAGRVAMPGFIANPAPFIAGADAFVLPSRFEGMPNAALEALALGTPVIATPEAGGIGEIGCVTLAEAGPAFAAAMATVPVRLGLRPSLLPAEFRLDNVVRQFNDLLATAIAD